jgi:sarcosine oxidase subunit gamma
VTVQELLGAGLATITARKGQRAALLERSRSAFGVELPVRPRHAEARGAAFIWQGPDQWLVRITPLPPSGMDALLVPALAGLASVVDQSHGRTLLRVSGPRARAALAKGVAIDLHPRAFMPGYAAVTSAAHIGVHLWQVDDAPTYELAVARSLARSFWHWLAAASAEYGLDVAHP